MTYFSFVRENPQRDALIVESLAISTENSQVSRQTGRVLGERSRTSHFIFLRSSTIS